MKRVIWTSLKRKPPAVALHRYLPLFCDIRGKIEKAPRMDVMLGAGLSILIDDECSLNSITYKAEGVGYEKDKQ